ncbi:MAG TPA: hypothetical protein VHS26_03550 [Solirubrobacteraceae bacterium]|nr:hypothetical protein [Solirubrobacteraceae bacterium]
MTLASDGRRFCQRRRRRLRDGGRHRCAGVHRRAFGVACLADIGWFDGHRRSADGGSQVARVRGR